MQMTDNEIYRNYKEAKKPAEQIQILADINACSTAKIKAIIESENRKAAKSKRGGKVNRCSGAEQDRIWELHCGGANIPEIVRLTGRKYDTVKKYIKKMEEEGREMIFAEELTAREREVLTEITENLDKPAETPSKPVNEPEELSENVTAVDIAKALLCLLECEFNGYAITIERTDSGYIVDVQGDKDGATLRRSFNG